MALTQQQISTLIIIERVTASISLTATLLLFTTFLLVKELRTLSNTLIFYASFANVFANVAALIGGEALRNENGALCQFQGFLLEMFMQSDPMWSCAMAVNVYLVFFHRYDAHRLKRLYWVYGLICYGLPFIPAIFCLLYKTKKKGKMYGNATVSVNPSFVVSFIELGKVTDDFGQLWCWIDNEWAAVRIYSYYAPVWVAILISLLVYLRVGIEIFQKRSELRAAIESNPKSTHHTATTPYIPMPAFSGTRTTEVQVTSDRKHSIPSPTLERPYPRPKNDLLRNAGHQKEAYTITISASHLPRSSLPSHTTSTVSSTSPISTITPHIPFPTKRQVPAIDKIKYAYTKTALLFAISILITWVPASVNRVYGLRYPHAPSFALNVGSAVVLPLQGFWNSVIFFGGSLGVLRALVKRKREGRRKSSAVGFVNLEVRGEGRSGHLKERENIDDNNDSRGNSGKEEEV
ncbi:hypothetical protein HYFRA_00005416 [Hymenoscyphus fraxineus]|uniref:G-protein coupled receptors family 2 profile 2 domain-containing protein n=1 Tax=Hymenoscyphus fraxineus TaxID=746836 RepID=A0A9N9KR74_9HELO|nr:hypothetical protein HYFRA_00005416 [Hymenoscyphus fraxineus]